MKNKQIAKNILELGRSLAVAVVVALFLNNVVIAHAKVISSSMESTIMTNSRIVGSRLAYVISEPQRFDIILFKSPDNETTIPFLKRIIGLPNEKVEIIDGKVYINDSDVPLDDSFIKEDAYGSYGPFIVPDNSYFVMGDNRNNSRDSKNWTNKFVSEDRIIGKIYVEYFPAPKLLN